MTAISPDRVAQAATAITDAGGSRADADVAKLMVLKYLGLQPGASLVVTNQDVIGACDYLYGAPGHEPWSWYEPFSGDWRKDAGNGGWPVGSVKTQFERPNRSLKALLNSEKVGAAVRVSLKGDEAGYIEALPKHIKARKFPLSEVVIWFSRNRVDLPNAAEVNLSALIDDFVELFHFSDGELETLFGDIADEGVPLVADEEVTPIGLRLPHPSLPRDRNPANPSEPEVVADEGYSWTQDYANKSFRSIDVRGMVETVKTLADGRDLVLPDEDTLIERCVVALLSGNLILQGPPGTGKTTLARLLAEAFSADVVITTATADWTTYDVIGGLRPTADGALAPILGAVPKTALSCAEVMRQAETQSSEADGSSGVNTEARWLIIDELNRADIDRAVGGLYTVLSTTDVSHLRTTPIDLWFEHKPERRLLWVPGRFRIIGTMNDVDTSFVNSISQGLTRRFQFVYVGVPSQDQTISEMELCRRQAQNWLATQYPDLDLMQQGDAVSAVLAPIQERMTDIFGWLRHGRHAETTGAIYSWPIGSAQSVDLWKAVLLTLASGPGITDESLIRAFDACFADRIVPQMGTLRSSHIAEIQRYFESEHAPLAETCRAVRHLCNTQSVR
ncbi:AAA family ATPase [Streptomyces sp. RM99]|uniref:AAA family ATPase n=1 Tax=Streptomyces sp. RM99 TaxID=2824897 RepID=UPI001B37A79A|nr:AAA family ATPase [Streptomyces sp. RM99]MBQ0912363.1 AAA family ATPase [Streptomyces sp. RM99]